MANLIGNNSNGGSNSVVGPANNSNNNIMLGMPNDNRVPIVMPNSSVVAAGQSASLRDVFLQPAITGQDGQPGGCPYDLIIDMMRGLDLQDDGILRNQKLKAIEMEFCNVVRTEEMLAACMEYMNNVSLADGDTALKFALLFSSRVFDALAMNETKVRCIMLTILETNYINAEMYRMKDRNLLYNSITMLGEYYHNVRLSNDSPIKILGKSLLNLLLREVSEHDSGVIDVKLAKLLLSQITLNGDIMREKHKEEMTQLLFHIRRNLIEQPALKAAVKALLLMSLDLYYSRFANLGTELEEMYKKYLVQDDEDELEPGSGCTMTAANQQQTYQNHMQQQPVQMTQQMLEQQQSQLHQQAQLQQQAQIQQQQQLQQQQQHQQLQQQQQLQLREMQQQQQQQIQMQQQQLPVVVDNLVEQDNSFDGGVLNGSSNSVGDDSYVVPPMTKKWSEQVCEDSLFENEFENECLNSSSAGGGGDGDVGDGGGYGGGGSDRANNSYGGDQRDKSLHSSNSNSRRSYNKQRNSPRPLKQHNNSSKDKSTENQHSQSAGEERDETKPLPKWRAPRFNRSDNEHDNHRHQQQRRYSTSYDDDHQSVRSDNGGSIRLYSVNDRLKHSQEKIDRHSNNAYNSIANSNWDRQSQRDDYSERSYMSNYERGNNNQRRGGGGRHYNNHHRQSYDKPPRFQKNQQQQHQQHHQQQHQQQYKEGGPIKSDTWRRSNANSINSYADENSSYPSNGPESNSRSSSRARTLPRPGKSKFDGGNNGGSSNYQQHQQRRSSQSPNRYGGSGGGGQYNHNNRGGGGGGGGGNRNRNYNNSRYNSQSSLVSEGSSTLERRHNNSNSNNNNNRNNRNFNRRSQQSPSEEDWDDTNSVHGQPEESSWDSKDNNNELVRNARNTTKYMNYLSSKK